MESAASYQVSNVYEYKRKTKLPICNIYCIDYICTVHVYYPKNHDCLVEDKQRLRSGNLEVYTAKAKPGAKTRTLNRLLTVSPCAGKTADCDPCHFNWGQGECGCTEWRANVELVRSCKIGNSTIGNNWHDLLYAVLNSCETGHRFQEVSELISCKASFHFVLQSKWACFLGHRYGAE